jgi:quercetin dioxygenase-like cupin family protein
MPLEWLMRTNSSKSALLEDGHAEAMNDSPAVPQHPAIPPDDPRRRLAIARPDDPALAHLGLVGDTYTILLTGDDTAGRYTLIDMHVPPGGGPPPHRHDFEEMFTVLDGEVELTFRGEHLVARAGETVNVPANAPHAFTNASGRPARLLCMCSPPGQEEFFLAVSEPVATRTEAPPALDEAATAAFIAKSQALAPQYRTELLRP